MKNMFIILEKVRKRIKSIFKIIGWKIMYQKDFSIGTGTVFYPLNHIIIEKNGKIKIGKNCFFNRNCSLNSLDEINIGNDCIFGESVKIYDHNHLFKETNTLIRKQKFETKKVTIGNNCWIGSNVIILPGVSIGNNVVVAAGSIVTKSIEDNCVFKNDISSTKRYY